MDTALLAHALPNKRPHPRPSDLPTLRQVQTTWQLLDVLPLLAEIALKSVDL